MLKRNPQNLRWRELEWRRPFVIEAVWELLIHLAALSPRGVLIWEARCTKGCVRYQLGAEPKFWSKIEAAIKPHGNIHFYDVEARTRRPVCQARHLKITQPLMALNTNTTLSTIRAGLAAMAAVRDGEESVLQIVLGGAYAPSALPAKMPDPSATWLQRVLGDVGPASPESRSSLRDKSGQHGFQSLVRIGITGTDNTDYLAGIHGALKTLESAGVRIHAYPDRPDRINLAHVPLHFPLRLSVKELANFLLLPAGEEELAGSEGLHPKQLLTPDWYKPPVSSVHERAFAMSMHRQAPQKLSISPQDSLLHSIIMGPTGSGKSTAMLHLVMADIQAGRSILVIDPKADLVTDILERIPEERANDVVVLDASDPMPVGFNPFAFKGYKNKALIADAVLAVLKEIFSENWGIRSQDILSGALLTLAEIEGASLLWLPALLTDESFRRKITAQVTDRIGLKPFWEHFESLRDSERRQEIAPVLNKMRQFLFRPGLRNVLGQANPKFNLTDMFHHRRIVLVPLNKSLVGAESARLLGSLIVGLTFTLALSRASISPERRHIVGVYLDEFQDFVALPTDLADALAQARGLGVSLHLAHQYREQLPPSIRAAVDANANNKIVFGLNSFDAKDMAAMAPELTAQDFMSLPRYQVYSTFHQNGRCTGWVQGQTSPMPPSLRPAAELRALSMTRYGRDAIEVEYEYLKTLFPDSASEEDASEASVRRRLRS